MTILFLNLCTTSIVQQHHLPLVRLIIVLKNVDNPVMSNKNKDDYKLKNELGKFLKIVEILEKAKEKTG